MEHAISTQPSRDVRDLTMQSNYHNGLTLILCSTDYEYFDILFILYKFDSIRFTNHINGYSHPYKMY